MNTQLKASKQTIRQFMQQHYEDTHLTQLLDSLRAGTFRYYSCCCFIGLLTADHEQRATTVDGEWSQSHYMQALTKYGQTADTATWCLGLPMDRSHEQRRHNRLIPMVLSEIRRRQRLSMIATKETEIHEKVS